MNYQTKSIVRLFVERSNELIRMVTTTWVSSFRPLGSLVRIGEKRFGNILTKIEIVHPITETVKISV